MFALRPGTIEQPHALVNLKVGRKHAASPYVSLANRLAFIKEALRSDHAARLRFEACYDVARNPEALVRELSLGNHPAIAAWRDQGFDQQAKLKTLAQVLYRCDLQTPLLRLDGCQGHQSACWAA